MGRLRIWAIRHELLAVVIAALIGAAVAAVAVAIPLASSLSSKDDDLDRTRARLSHVQRELAGVDSRFGRGASTIAPSEKWTTIRTFTGARSARTDPFELPSGELRIAYTFGGHTNDIVNLNPPQAGKFSGYNLVNESGSVTDSTRIEQPPGTYYLDVTGTDWTIEIQQIK